MKRESGYYWVRFLNFGQWEIAYFNKNGTGWKCIGIDYRETIQDKDFYEIDERRIHEPE